MRKTTKTRNLPFVIRETEHGYVHVDDGVPNLSKSGKPSSPDIGHQRSTLRRFDSVWTKKAARSNYECRYVSKSRKLRADCPLNRNSGEWRRESMSSVAKRNPSNFPRASIPRFYCTCTQPSRAAISQSFSAARRIRSFYAFCHVAPHT